MNNLHGERVKLRAMSACITFRYPVGYHKLLQRSTVTEVIQNSWREIVARIRPRAIYSVCRKQSEIAMVYLTSLCDWSRKLALPSQPIKLITETKRSLVTHVFPRFRQFAWFFFFDFSLALNDIFPALIGCCDNFVFGPTTPNRVVWSLLSLSCLVRTWLIAYQWLRPF